MVMSLMQPYKPFQLTKLGGFGNGGPASITMSVWASSLIAAGLPVYLLPFTHTLSALRFAACADAASVFDRGWPQISKKSPSVNVRSRGASMWMIPSAYVYAANRDNQRPAAGLRWQESGPPSRDRRSPDADECADAGLPCGRRRCPRSPAALAKGTGHEQARSRPPGA